MRQFRGVTSLARRLHAIERVAETPCTIVGVKASLWRRRTMQRPLLKGAASLSIVQCRPHQSDFTVAFCLSTLDHLL